MSLSDPEEQAKVKAADRADPARDSMRNVVVVLAGTTHPGNIGFCARAMKTMGVCTLRLAAPLASVDNTAIANATNASDVLDHCSILDSVPAALEGCSVVFAFSARRRRHWTPEHVPLRDSMAKALAHLKSGRRVALLFGNEKAGLSNEEASHADLLVEIPTSPDFPSLNLSHALQVALYELRVQLGSCSNMKEEKQHVPAAVEYREQMFMHFERVARRTGMVAEESSRPFMARLRRILTRAELDHEEVNMLRGFLASVEKKSNRDK